MQIILDRARTEAVLGEERRRVVLSREVLRMQIPGTSLVPPPPDVFYGLAGGLARYDARTLGLADGAPVSTWGDASEQVADAVQDVAGRMPTYTSAVPGVAFGSAGYYLRLPADLRFSLAASWTLVGLLDRVDERFFQSVLTLGQTAGTLEWSLSASGGSGAATHYGGAYGGSGGGAWPAGGSVVARTADGSDAVVYVDGAPAVVRSAGTAEAEPTARPVIGGLVDAAGSVAAPFRGIVHDLLIYDRALSPAELAALRAAMAADWGI